jgi:DNA-binding FadR family transcriptional regulator
VSDAPRPAVAADAADPDPARRSSRAKLASAVAGRIVADIAAAGWPEGEVFGSETDLIARYGVSRAVFREAIRLLEHQDVARMRRGPGGGLVVMAPTVESVIEAAMIYLFHLGVRLEEVFEVRLVLETKAAELAATRSSEEHRRALREIVERELSGEHVDHREFHAAVAAASANPAVEFLTELLNRVTLLYAPEAGSLTHEIRSAATEAHGMLVESITAKNAGEAGRRMRRHLDAEVGFIRDHLPARLRADVVFAKPDGSTKMAETVAQRIFATVAESGWEVGAPLGSESALMERFGISRAVLREAVRVLEHHQIARMRRGPGGGLFVAEPGVEATTEAVALHLSQRGIGPEHLFEVRSIVEMTALDRVVEHFDESAATELDRVLEIERTAPLDEFPVVGHDFHCVLATISGNRVLELLANVLVELSRGRGPIEVPDEAVSTAEVIRAHRSIVDAVAAHDVELARNRMQRHLDAVIRWIG